MPTKPYHNTLCHEMGHVFGLDHSMVESALMLESDLNEDSDTKLDPDDIDGIQELYGQPDGKVRDM